MAENGLTQAELGLIKDNIEWRAGEADRILNGGDNYDGADGARIVRDLCQDAKRLIAEIERLQQDKAASA